MMNLLKKLFRDTFTEPDGVTFCPARAMALGMTVSGIGLAVVDVVVHKHPFDLQQFGIGAGALFGGTGAMLQMKKDAK
jgi:hypothetical protein